MTGKLTDRPKRVSLKDLARELNVSVTAVSRALHDSPEISIELRTRVHELANRWNYRPNPFAQSLRKGAPKLIGVVVPSMNSHYHSSVIAGLEDEARKAGYSVICANSHESSADESVCIENLMAMHVDGIVVCLSQETTDYTKFEELLEANVPVVLFARTCLQDRISSVVSEDTIASSQATHHLLEQGCRRIGFIGGPNHLDMVRRRKHGFIEALHDARIKVEPSFFKCGRLDRPTAYEAARQLIAEQHVDAIFAINYDSLYGALDAIREAGLSVPADIALIGFVDDPDVSYLTPAVSSIVDMSYDIGTHCCQILLKHIGGSQVVYHEVLPMRINIRQSSLHGRQL